MQKIFDEVNSLDKRCYEKFFLTEDILMEHASNGMASYINQTLSHKKSILIVCHSKDSIIGDFQLFLLVSMEIHHLYLPLRDPHLIEVAQI